MSDPAASTWWWWDKWELSLLDMELESSRPKTLCKPRDSWMHASCKGLLFQTPRSEKKHSLSVLICLAHKQSSFERWVEVKISYTCAHKYMCTHIHAYMHTHTQTRVFSAIGRRMWWNTWCSYLWVRGPLAGPCRVGGQKRDAVCEGPWGDPGWRGGGGRGLGGDCSLATGPSASSLWLLPGRWLGIIRNAWSPYPSFGLMDGAEGGGWLFSFCFFLSYSAD